VLKKHTNEQIDVNVPKKRGRKKKEAVILLSDNLNNLPNDTTISQSERLALKKS
ncbi:9884_t:CDS:1, partial [Gigaspora rosea]